MKNESIKTNVSKLIGLLKESYKNYTRSIAMLSVLGVVQSLFDGLGVTIVIPIFGLLTNTQIDGSDKITAAVQSAFEFFGVDFAVNNLLLLIFLLFIFKFLAGSLAEYVRADVMTRYEQNTMSLLFNRMVDSSWAFLSKQKIGHVENMLFVEVDYGRKALIMLSKSIVMIASVIIYAALAFNISAPITFSTLIFGALVLYAFKRSAFKIKRDSSEVNVYNKKVAHYVNERTIGMKTIKAMGAGEKIKGDASFFFSRLRSFRLKVLLRKKITGAIFEPLSISYVLMLFYLFYARPDFQMGAFAVIIFLIQRIFDHTRQVQSLFYLLGESAPFLQNIVHQAGSSHRNKERNLGEKKFSFERSLIFNNVNFAYEPDKNVLENISFHVAKGEMLGIVGPSGAGKTSLTDLILRLLSPTSGTISIDGVDITDIDLNDWRKNVGYVSQDIFLIDGTAAENIRFYNETLSNDDIEAAAKKANMYEFFDSKPERFDAQVGERGLELSAGQRQRIVIARVLARNPKLLILDEATSALDSHSEQAIRDVIKGLKGQITIMTIAHRLSTVMDCDRIIAIEDGKIVESGSPEFLMSTVDSYFYKTYRMGHA